MKKIYLLISLFLSIQSVNAQSNTVIWSDDFSIPSNWLMIDVLHGGSQNWVIDTNGPTGYFSGSMGIIQSTTSFNGFALFDSDALNNSYGISQDAILFCDSVIDCSNWSDININFESYHRKYHDSVFVEVSTDSIVWDRYEVHSDLGVTYSSTNPEKVSINISPTAGGANTVYIRFRYEGEWDYAWMIDDVSITPIPDYSMSCTDGSFLSVASSNDLDINYTFYPIDQALLSPYRFSSMITNNGIQDLSSVIMHVEIEKDTFVWNLYSDTGTLVSGEVDTFFTSSDFLPADTLGLYNFTFRAFNDTLCGSESFEMKSMVTDTTYGVDYDWDSDGSSVGGGYYSGNATCGQVLGNVFNIYNDQVASSISFHVNQISSIGAELQVEIYKIDSLNTHPIFTLIDASDYIQLDSTHINSWVTLALSDSTVLSAGNLYLAAVRGVAGPFESMISSSANSNSITFIQDNGCNLVPPNPPGTWFTLSHSLLIRMNIAWPTSILSINNINIESNIQIFPNPTNGTFSIDIQNQESFGLTIQNLVGQIVYQNHFQSEEIKNINLSNHHPGIYLLEIDTDNGIVNKKLVLQ